METEVTEKQNDANALEHVSQLTLGERQIYLLGTAHVSRKSVIEVKEAVERIKPDTICVELCAQRYEAIVNRDAWKQMDIVKVIREKRTHVLLMNLILASFQRRIAESMDVKPGQEMLQGIESAKEIGAELVLVDRNVQVTLTRAWSGLSFIEKAKLLTQVIGGVFVDEKVSEETVERLKQEDLLGSLLKEVADTFPRLKTVLIDERDRYLAAKISKAPGKKILAIVGAGHVPGIKQFIASVQDISELDLLPKKSILPRLIGWAIPLFIVALVLLTFSFDTKIGLHQIEAWILWNGSLSSLGTLCAFGHPLSIITAFIFAPITPLHPLIAVGWFAGLTEALVRKPKVSDIENLPHDTKSVRGFWKNRVTRILLVVVFANLGCMAGTFLAGYEIVRSFYSLT